MGGVMMFFDRAMYVPYQFALHIITNLPHQASNGQRPSPSPSHPIPSHSLSPKPP